MEFVATHQILLPVISMKMSWIISKKKIGLLGFNSNLHEIFTESLELVSKKEREVLLSFVKFFNILRVSKGIVNSFLRTVFSGQQCIYHISRRRKNQKCVYNVYAFFEATLWTTHIRKNNSKSTS